MFVVLWVHTPTISIPTDDPDIILCDNLFGLRIYLLLGLCILPFSVLFDLIVAWISLLGTVANPHPRRHIGKFLYVHIALIGSEMVTQIYGLILIYGPDHISCPKKGRMIVLLHILNILSIITLALWTMAVLPLFLGSRQQIDMDAIANNTRNLTRTKHKSYRSCLYYCCFGHRETIATRGTRTREINETSTTSESTEDVLNDIAKIIAEFLGDIDIVPSDILVGLILLRRQQIMQRSSKSQLKIVNISTESFIQESVSSSIPLSQVLNSQNIHANLESSPVNVQQLSNIAHFYQYAESIYGLPLYLFSNISRGNFAICCPQIRKRTNGSKRALVTEFVQKHYVSFGWPFCFLPSWSPLKIDRTSSFRNQQAVSPRISRINSTQQPRKIAWEPHDDLVYLSLENTLYKPPFLVALDHEKSCVVVAIRGTLSTIDVLVDLNCDVVRLDDCDNIEGASSEDYDLWTHAGMLKSAKLICEELASKNVLDTLMTSGSMYDQYNVLCCGHSLGGGVASLVAYLLRTRYNYPNTTCIAYSPPGCMVSEIPTTPCTSSNSMNKPNKSQKHTPFSNFCTSVVLGTDLVPRTSLHTLNNLKQQIQQKIHTCNEPKIQVLGSALINGILGVNRMQILGGSIIARAVRDSWIVMALAKFAEWTSEKGITESQQLDVENRPLYEGRISFESDNYSEDVDSDVLLNPGIFESSPITYLPGRIIYFEKKRDGERGKDEYVPRWGTREEFQEIVISASMMADHLPNNLGLILDRAMETNNSEGIVVGNTVNSKLQPFYPKSYFSTSIAPNQPLTPSSLVAPDPMQLRSPGPDPMDVLEEHRRNLPKSPALSQPNFYQNRILEQYAAQETKRVTLRQLTVFGRQLSVDKLVKSGNYVRTELIVRLAHRIRDFQNLPFIVGTNPHVELMYQLYWSAFEKFRTFPVLRNLDDNRKFCSLLESLLKEHLIVIPQLAMGIAESTQHMSPRDADKFMNEMLRSRIGRRVLAEQHIAMSSAFEGKQKNTHDHWIGIVHTRCHAMQTVSRCANLAAKLFRDAYKVEPPQVLIDGAVDATFTYIPDQIEYILYELLKNSMRFTIEKHAPQVLLNNNDLLLEAIKNSELGIASTAQTELVKSKMPMIRVTIGEGSSELMFRVSDQGGGINRDTLQHLWSYSHESKRKFLNFDQGRVQKLAAKVEERIPASLHLGLGLPMSKVYANYWGGSIVLHTVQGYGTDAYVKIGTGNEIEQLDYEDD
ncbi:hypothetical protein HK096_004623 [Nowakowskiella sp. JEL0078]|nr:hypothetical protein HK096_004623 [Nowakowskiella sp. JEL0078]